MYKKSEATNDFDTALIQIMLLGTVSTRLLQNRLFDKASVVNELHQAGAAGKRHFDMLRFSFQVRGKERMNCTVCCIVTGPFQELTPKQAWLRTNTTLNCGKKYYKQAFRDKPRSETE